MIGLISSSICGDRIIELADLAPHDARLAPHIPRASGPIKSGAS